jgi:hypothetical protein
MKDTHVPAQLALFRYDLGNSQIATVRCRDGYPQDCVRRAGDRIGLVLLPSLVRVIQRDDSKPADLTWVGLDQAVSIEFDRGSNQEVRWVRDPNGLWLRLTAW